MDTRVTADGTLIRRYALALTPARQGQAMRPRLRQPRVPPLSGDPGSHGSAAAHAFTIADSIGGTGSQPAEGRLSANLVVFAEFPSETDGRPAVRKVLLADAPGTRSGSFRLTPADGAFRTEVILDDAGPMLHDRLQFDATSSAWGGITSGGVLAAIALPHLLIWQKPITPGS
jgi:hypothetical protein